MALITDIQLRDCSIEPSKLNTAGIFTVSGLSACMIAVGSNAAAAGNPPRGCFDLNTSDSVSAYFSSSSGTGRSTIIVKVPENEWHIKSEGTDLTISSSGGTGVVCIPSISGSLSGTTSSQWTTTGGETAIYYDGCVGVKVTDPQYPFHISGQFCSDSNIDAGGYGAFTGPVSGSSSANFTSNICTQAAIVAASTIDGTIITGSTCLTSPEVCATTTVISPIVSAPTCVTSPEVCATTSINTPVLCATDCIVANYGFASNYRSTNFFSCCTGAIAGCPTGALIFEACDGGGDTQQYGRILACITDGTAAAECGGILIDVMCGGAYDTRTYIRWDCVAIHGGTFCSSSCIVSSQLCSTGCIVGQCCVGIDVGCFKCIGVQCCICAICICSDNIGVVTTVAAANLCATAYGCMPNLYLTGVLVCEAGGQVLNCWCAVCQACLHIQVACNTGGCAMISLTSGKCYGSVYGGFLGSSGTTGFYICSCLHMYVKAPCYMSICANCIMCFYAPGYFFCYASCGNLWLHPRNFYMTATGSACLDICVQNSCAAICQRGNCGMQLTTCNTSGVAGCTAIIMGTTTRTLTLYSCACPTFNVCYGNACTPYNMCVGGTLGKAAGSFVIDHPCCCELIPNKYNSMNLIHGFEEGPKYGIFYEGDAHLCCGHAVINLPEYFDKLVNRKDGIYVHLTPVGSWTGLIVMNSNCVVCGNCFQVCTVDDGINNMCGEFTWRVSATRGDKYVIEDNTQTDDDGLLIVEQWKRIDNIENADIALDALTEPEMNEWFNYSKRKIKKNSNEQLEADTKDMTTLNRNDLIQRAKDIKKEVKEGREL